MIRGKIFLPKIALIFFTFFVSSCESENSDSLLVYEFVDEIHMKRVTTVLTAKNIDFSYRQGEIEYAREDWKEVGDVVDLVRKAQRFEVDSLELEFLVNEFVQEEIEFHKVGSANGKIQILWWPLNDNQKKDIQNRFISRKSRKR